MKLVLNALAVIVASTLLAGCGERPMRPKTAVKGGSDDDRTITLSKNVVNVVTKKDITGKTLKVKLDGAYVVSPCQGDELLKLTDNSSGYSLVLPEKSAFGIRNVFVVHEYAADSTVQQEAFEFIIAESCSDAAPKVVSVNVEFTNEDLDLPSAAETGKTFVTTFMAD